MSTTAIYTEVAGPEEVAFAERFWRLCEGGSIAYPIRRRLDSGECIHVLDLRIKKLALRRGRH